MAVTSTSTYAEVNAQYDDNAGYETVASAKLFIQACRILIRRAPTRSGADGVSSDRGEGFQRNLEKQIAEAEQFISQNSADSDAVRYTDFQDFRR